MHDLEHQIEELESNKTTLENRTKELRLRCELLGSFLYLKICVNFFFFMHSSCVEKREDERKSAEENRRREELDFLKYQGQHLDSYLNQIASTK